MIRRMIRGRVRTGLAACVLAGTLIAGGLFGATAWGEQASSEFRRLPSGFLDAGNEHTCAILAGGQLACWGYANDGNLGYNNTEPIGDDEVPAAAGPVFLGLGRTAYAITAGDDHTCAILDTGDVRCWGDGFDGELGYGNTTEDIGDDELPGSVGPVDLGSGRTARAITAGDDHACAIVDTGRVLCWGYVLDGRLGYGNETENIGDDETPGSVGPVDLGTGRTAVAISAGADHTCAVLDTGEVRCWGDDSDGRLGYGSPPQDIGDTETPGSVGPVDLGAGRTAVAIAAGGYHTCAVLDTGQVRCWGEDGAGQLGYGSPPENIGDTETPGSVGPVDLGAGRTAVAISAGADHTCAVLDTGQVRCWGDDGDGRLGYGSPPEDIGDTETPGSVGPVDLGGLVATSKAPQLSLKAKPRRDGREPFRFKVTDELSGPFILDDAVCSGDVVIKSKPKITRKKTADLEFASGECTLRTKVKGTRDGSAKLIARFEGNGSLDPDKAKKKIRAG